jgi:hypothetical protein
MTAIKGNTNNSELHARLTLLQAHEAKAADLVASLYAERATVPDDYRKAEAAWERLWDEKADLENQHKTSIWRRRSNPCAAHRSQFPYCCRTR